MRGAISALGACAVIAACARASGLGGATPAAGAAQSATARAAALVARMTLDEKVSQLVTDARAIPRLGVPAYNWWNEALHGVARAGRATVFPQAIGLAATFDEALVRRVATVIALEARAKHDEAARDGATGLYEGLTFFSPNLNIFRDPRWGRGQETYGEDPFLTARLGVAFIRGLQGDDGRWLAAAATAKHFAAHSGPEALRHGFDARVTPHDLADTYLPQFEAAVRDGHVAGVMPAYNRLNGEPCAASPTLLEATLRRDWGFDGYVVSDCGAVGDIYKGHGVVDTREKAAALALNAGTDLSCGNEFLALARAQAQGLVTEAAIDRAATRLFAIRFRLGLFDPAAAVRWAGTPASAVDAPAHRALAREAARESLVLLENHDGLLPLGHGVRRLAVIGPTADDREVLLGNYHGEPSRAVTPLEGLRAAGRARGVTVTYARGAPLVGRGVSSAQLTEALAAARRSDVVVAVLGLSARQEGEEGDSSGDRVDLGLPRGQQRLLEALVATGKPVILVLTAGSALAVPWAAAHVQAIVYAWYPGEEGGAALADVLFGDVSPAGRLPITLYRATDDLPPFADYSMRGRTYRYLERPALYDFGFGRSFSTFRYAHVLVPATLVAGADAVVSVEVRNTGGRAADEVVQVYVARPGAPAYAPRRWLAAFARVTLAAGERRVVPLALPARAFSLVDERGARVTPPGAFALAVGGGQPDAAWSFAGGGGVTASVALVPPTGGQPP